MTRLVIYGEYSPGVRVTTAIPGHPCTPSIPKNIQLRGPPFWWLVLTHVFIHRTCVTWCKLSDSVLMNMCITSMKQHHTWGAVHHSPPISTEEKSNQFWFIKWIGDWDDEFSHHEDFIRTGMPKPLVGGRPLETHKWDIFQWRSQQTSVESNQPTMVIYLRWDEGASRRPDRLKPTAYQWPHM